MIYRYPSTNEIYLEINNMPLMINCINYSYIHTYIYIYIYIYILVAWQGHRGDQKRKKTPSQILLKAPKPNAAARTLYYKNVCFFPCKIKGVPKVRFGQKIKKCFLIIRSPYWPNMVQFRSVELEKWAIEYLTWLPYI